MPLEFGNVYSRLYTIHSTLILDVAGVKFCLHIVQRHCLKFYLLRTWF